MFSLFIALFIALLLRIWRLHPWRNHQDSVLCMNINSAPYLTCRRTLMSILAERFRASRSVLTHLFSESNFVATTADCWSAHNRSFLGMTAHWIDPCDLSRKDAMLCSLLPRSRCKPYPWYSWCNCWWCSSGIWHHTQGEHNILKLVTN